MNCYLNSESVSYYEWFPLKHHFTALGKEGHKYIVSYGPIYTDRIPSLLLNLFSELGRKATPLTCLSVLV